MKKLTILALGAAGLALALSACAPGYDRYDRYGYGYSSPRSYYDSPRGYYDADRDGIPNRYDRDRDNDGVPNYADTRPSNPYRN